MSTLYELSDNYLQALAFFTDPENEIDADTINDTMEGLDGELEDKLLNVSKFIVSLEYQAQAIKDIAKKQADRAKALDNKAKWLRDYLIGNMQRTGKLKIDSPEIAISLAKLPLSVNVIDEDMIPNEFWREKVERTIDKTAIKNHGGCPGVVIESNGFRVSIK